MGQPSERPPFGQRAERYWVQSRQPLASLVFIAPLLVVYEAGVLLLGVQNGADAFMRRLLDLLGFGQHFVLPILTVCILLAWHYLSRQPWRLSPSVIPAMAIESLMLGVCLRVISFVQDSLVTLSAGGQIKHAVGYLGAGIYEELLFRLILLSVMAWALRHAGTTPRMSLVLAALLTSLLFAAAHYRFVWPGGEDFQWYSFAFRFLAGMFFAVVFIYRGFGIAAGSHAAYDLVVGLL